ncbi:VP9D1 protein, partial [Formicarius rufipectus]|nr:VP9D1 protein [Formicarius rufipectus]
MAAPAGTEGSAPGRGAARGLQGAMRAASEALGMDSAGRTREAYMEYLKSITLIAQTLQEEAAGTDGSDGVTPDTPKLLKLAEQCLERVKSIAAALGECPGAKPAVQERGGSPAPLPRHRRVCSDEGGKLSPELTPLEEASLQNQKLKAAYEARVARLNPSQALQKTSLTLSLQRQMMENLVIAKAREETLQRKVEERRLRLQEAANRRFSSSVALTPEEQEQRELYAAILEYEQDHDWPRQWKAQLQRSPADLSVGSGVFSCLLRYCQPSGGSSLPPEPGPRRLRASRSLHCMFSVPEHGAAALRHSRSSTPLADGAAPGPPQAPRESSFEDLERFLASPEGWAPPEPPAGSGQGMAAPELLKGIVRDIHNAIDRLLALTLLAFEGLGTAAGKDQCLACLEEAFFPPLWAPLLALYRYHHPLWGARPHRPLPGSPSSPCARRALGPWPGTVSGEGEGGCGFWARGVPGALVPIADGAGGSRGWWGVGAPVPIATMAECPRYHSGADDLLPILSYVVLQTGLPQLLSECAALEEFIHEGYLIGEEGYCLTSLQSALSYVESLQ